LHQTGSLDGVSDLLVDFKERQRLVRKPQFDEAERRYAVVTDAGDRLSARRSQP
jgi:hypothetical protein